MWHSIWKERTSGSEMCIIYFKARVYLLQTNCGRGSALEGCALGREGGGPRGPKWACLSLWLYQKNTVATALKIRGGRVNRFTGGNKINERGKMRGVGGGQKTKREWERKRHVSVCVPTPQWKAAVIKAGRRSWVKPHRRLCAPPDSKTHCDTHTNTHFFRLWLKTHANRPRNSL